MNRREVEGKHLIAVLTILRDEISKNCREKGSGAFVSPHEILGAITEEYHELVQAVTYNGSLKEELLGIVALEEELLDIAALCVFALAGLQGEGEA